MNPTERAGRVILVSLLLLVLAISLVTIAVFLSARGAERLPAQVIRFTLTVALSFWLYRGSNAAKWICVVLFCIGGGLSTVPLMRANDLWEAAFAAFMCIVYLSFATVLLWSPSVNAFLAFQRGERKT